MTREIKNLLMVLLVFALYFGLLELLQFAEHWAQQNHYQGKGKP